MLRDYQQKSIDMLYDWMSNNDGNPCAVLPTGAGKSHIVAALCKDAVQNWPDTKILMLTHVKELIEQNSEKMRQHWRNAPMGIYSAGMGKRQLGEPITFAGIQSVRTRGNDIGHIDLIIIDECHLINHKAEGGYRELIAQLTEINPAIRVIGLTATPFRLGHGFIHEGDDTIFDDLIEPVSIEELIYKKHLAPLRSKITKAKLETDGVKKRGGEYIEADLQKAVNTQDTNLKVISEVLGLSENRKAWLFFCTGIDHALAIKDELIRCGIVAECVTGKTPKKERARILEDFKAGKIKALTNANVLTTGFDYPDIDLIVMLRPTMSPSLYVQMAGRGLRPKSHTDHCLVLDFAGAVETHGPITAVKPPEEAKEGGEAPCKACEKCDEIVHASCKICPECGAPFPEPEIHEKIYTLRNSDIMGNSGTEMEVKRWAWLEHVSRTSGIKMIRVTYYGNLSDKPVSEYLCIHHTGYAQTKALRTLAEIMKNTNCNLSDFENSSELCDFMNSQPAPGSIDYIKSGKYFQVVKRNYEALAFN